MDRKKRVAEAVKLSIGNPSWTLARVGQEMGITRERVRQLLAVAGLNIKDYRIKPERPPCPVCGSPVPTPGNKFCSSQCRHQYFRVKLHCMVCGKQFDRKRSAVKAHSADRRYSDPPRYFCNKRCFGRWCGTNYGFVAHPENTDSAKRKGTSKYDKEAIWEKHVETGFGAVRLGRLLGLTEPTTSWLLGRLHAERGIKPGVKRCGCANKNKEGQTLAPRRPAPQWA